MVPDVSFLTFKFTKIKQSSSQKLFVKVMMFKLVHPTGLKGRTHASKKFKLSEYTRKLDTLLIQFTSTIIHIAQDMYK